MDNKNKSTMKRGFLIVFEGIDGTGKSTQLELLADYLIDNGYIVVKTKEPTNGFYGKQIRDLYLNRDEVSKEEELNLFLLDRQEHVNNLIVPSLAENKIVLCDRYYLSTIAYQGAAGFDVEELEKKNSFAPEPDIALLFQSDLQSSIERITKERGDILNDFEQEDSLQKVESIFNSMRYKYIKHINANQSIESVHQAVLSTISGYLVCPN